MADIIDSYSLSDPVNVLSKIPESFYENVESAKWKDRKDALDLLLSILKVPKIEDGHYGNVLAVLVKVPFSEYTGASLFSGCGT